MAGGSTPDLIDSKFALNHLRDIVLASLQPSRRKRPWSAHVPRVAGQVR